MSAAKAKTEGEIHAERDANGLNQLAGHEANLSAWEASPAGQQFIKDAKANEENSSAKAEPEKVEADPQPHREVTSDTKGSKG